MKATKQLEWLAMTDGRLIRWDGEYIDFLDIAEDAPVWTVTDKAAVTNRIYAAVRLVLQHGDNELPAHLFESAEVLEGDDTVRIDNWHLMMFAWQLRRKCDELKFR
jgi:hypothetical protein